MKQFIRISVVVASQLLLAGLMANDFHHTGSGVSLFLAVLCGFVAVVAAVAGYVGRNNPPRRDRTRRRFGRSPGSAARSERPRW
jgi:hypothetical protein